MITKKGTVVKKSGDKTIKVQVHSYQAHPKYKKRYRSTKHFLAHDPEGKANEGDSVVITQTKPISKKKTWILTSIES